jgi:CheY-like chemotaxis protein
MDGWSGWTCSSRPRKNKRLRDEPLLDKTRFVALSANAMAQDVAQALGAGSEDYWTKPIDFGKFLAGIDAIAARGTERSVRSSATQPSPGRSQEG